jgi:membrane-bound inhibitor of C-type lysozyme
MMKKTCVVAVGLAVSACGMIDRLWTRGPTEQPRLAAGAVEFRCDANRSLVLRLEERAAWVLLPEREFRLDAAPSASGSRYSNGRTTLVMQGSDQASLEEGSTVTHANCRRAQGSN